VDDKMLEIIQGHINEDWAALLRLEQQGKLDWY
jgi:hypothetical protein